MALRDPFAAYNARTNVEAHQLRDVLRDSGVEAHVVEDTFQGGTRAGHISEIDRIQVWIGRDDIERATPILEGFERRVAELQDAGADGKAVGGLIEVVCEECGARSSFPAVQRGSVQQCSACAAFLDVGDDGASDEWAESDEGAEDEA